MHRAKDNGCDGIHFPLWAYRIFFSLRPSLRSVGDDRICHLYRNNSKTRRRRRKKREENLADLNTTRCKIVKVACRDNRVGMFTVSLSSYDHDRKKSLFSLFEQLWRSFFLLFFPHIFKTHNRETKEEKKCESVVDMQIESKQKQKKKKTTSTTGEG